MLYKFSFLFSLVVFLSSCGSSSKSSSSDRSFALAIMQVKEPIEGACNSNKIVAILPFPGGQQVEAVPPMTEAELEARLNAIAFLQEQSNFTGKGMISQIVNCRGQLVKCNIDNSTGNAELDAQLVAVAAKMEQWKPGTVNGQSVDTVVLTSFTIENGRLSL